MAGPAIGSETWWHDPGFRPGRAVLAVRRNHRRHFRRVNDQAPLPRPFSGADYIAIILMNLMWGLNLIAVKMGVELAEPMTAAWLRQLFVLIICIPFLKFVPGKMKELAALGILSGGLFYIVTNLSLAASDNVAALAIAGQLGAPFSLILAVIFLKERVARYGL